MCGCEVNALMGRALDGDTTHAAFQGSGLKAGQRGSPNIPPSTKAPYFSSNSPAAQSTKDSIMRAQSCILREEGRIMLSGMFSDLGFNSLQAISCRQLGQSNLSPPR